MRVQRVRWWAGWVLLGGLLPVLAMDDGQEPPMWGLAMSVRSATVPYAGEIDRVNDLIPLLYYEHNRLFVHGLTAGYRIYDTPTLQLSALGRYRFFDIPAEYQKESRGNAFDMGGQMKHWLSPSFDTDFELLSDSKGRVHANLRANYLRDSGRWELRPSVTLRWKSAAFNNHYYGLDIAEPGSAVDASVAAELRYHVYRNLYVLGRAQITALDHKTADTGVIDRRFPNEVMLGFGFFNEKTVATAPALKAKPFLRLAHGWATPSDLLGILGGQREPDPYDNQITSLFFGVPVSDTLMGWPLQIYFMPGIVYHHSSQVQDDFPEIDAAFKAFYTFRWPVRVRLGAAEGLSYTSQINYIEASTRASRNERPSKLLNFLDVSADFNLGDLFKDRKLNAWWLGYGIHHRSGIFQKSSAFGRIKGGSNYTQVYLQYEW